MRIENQIAGKDNVSLTDDYTVYTTHAWEISQNPEISCFSETRFGTQTCRTFSGIENCLNTIHNNLYKRGECPEPTSYTVGSVF